jgi:ribosome biogenesis GTPase / thiamine phosphate phosphatase
MTDSRRSGTVLRSHGGVYEVETAGGVVEASLRGRIKRDERSGEKVVAGDRVELACIDAGAGETWVIETVHERRSALLRRAPGKAPRPKVIVANVDRVLIVFAVARPEPHLRMLDRFLVLCESSGLDALIVANKLDLTGSDAARETFGLYEEIGYPVLYTSVKQGVGIEELRQALHGTTSVLTGPSGVGKSSLLNAVQPGLGLRVASISDAVLKGRHTTVTAQLIALEGGGYVADTPGLRELGLWGIELEDLDTCFPEFHPYLGTCRYGNSCTHTHEPGCAIKDAVASGALPAVRYDSYRRLREEDDGNDE